MGITMPSPLGRTIHLFAFTMGSFSFCSRPSRRNGPAEELRRTWSSGIRLAMGLLLDKGYFVISYDMEARIPKWVAYRLRRGDLTGAVDRTDDFRVDDDLDEDPQSEGPKASSIPRYARFDQPPRCVDHSWRTSNHGRVKRREHGLYTKGRFWEQKGLDVRGDTLCAPK